MRLTATSWMVIDLELCSSAPVRLPRNYQQTEWGPSTTEPDGPDHCIYTTLSDMHQIGKMLSRLVTPACSAAAHKMVAALLARDLSAEAALEEDWLLGLPG